LFLCGFLCGFRCGFLCGRHGAPPIVARGVSTALTRFSTYSKLDQIDVTPNWSSVKT